MIAIRLLKQWIDAVAENDPDAVISVDDGGLTLIAGTGEYLEVGGEPDEEDHEVDQVGP